MRIPRWPGALALALLLPLAAPASAEDARLTILHTTDLHGRLTDQDLLADRPVAGGLVRVASLVSSIRAEGHPVLLLDAGDAMQGGAIGMAWRQKPGGRPEPMMAAMRSLGYDAMAVGNHEFDFGPEALAQARADAGFPWLSSNVLSEDGKQAAFQRSLVKTLGPLRVGVVGVTTPAVPEMVDAVHLGAFRFTEPVEAVRAEVARLRGEERCDVVVLLAHTGLERDPASGDAIPGGMPSHNWGYRLAGIDGIDVVLLGHTHRIIEGAEFGSALIAQAGHMGRGLGRVDLTLERSDGTVHWRIEDRTASQIAVTDSTPVDAAIAALAQPYADQANELLERSIGRASGEVASPYGRLSDGSAWELVHRAQLWASRAQVSLASLTAPTATIPPGPIQARQIMRLYPYENALAVVELTGADLKATLEHAARMFMDYSYAADRPVVDPDASENEFDSAEGVSYEIDLTRPAGDRVVNLRFENEPLDPERRLKVAVSTYRLNGGGGYAALQNAPRVWRSQRNIRDILVDFVKRARTLDGSYTRNWRLLPDYAATPERPLIDLLVRQGVAPKDEVHRLGATEPARRGDVAYWLARAFDWQSEKRSRAFGDVPEALEPWVDALMQRRVIGESAVREDFEPFQPASAWLALDWCENAARASGYSLASELGDPGFRRSLLTGVSFDAERARHAEEPGGFTRAQLLGIVANVRYPTLRILSTNDFHGAILPSRDRRSGRMQGGSAVLAAHVERLRSENPYGTILLDGGDCFQGTMISNLQFGRPVVEQMNALEYTAMAIGNHEFDWTVDTLENRAHEMRFSALGANFIENATGRMPDWVRSDTLFTRRGLKVGVLGLSYRFTPNVTLASHVADYHFEDDSVVAARIAPRLRKRDGAEIVLGVGHVPANSDRQWRPTGGDLVRMARSIPDVNAWFGGHSHIFVNGDVDGVPVMIAGSHGRAVSVCDLVVDPLADRVIEQRTRLQMTWADEVDPDQAWHDRVDRWNADVAPIAATPVGHSVEALDRSGPESTIGNMMCDAIRHATGADVAMQNSGGMRANLDAGAVTKGEVYAIMPFDNTIVTVELTGDEVKRVLDEAMRRGRVTQVSGIRYTYDPGRPEMQRVLDVTDANGKPLDKRRRYTVAVNNFMATGGDDYSTLAEGRNTRDTGLLLRAAIESWIRERTATDGALDVKRDGRIKQVDSAGSVGSN